ncbi:MAG: hypothetical protein IFK92_06370 [Acidobacteria bacterium]|nr:hypothetical protein [Candidatus Sulfomarinibacter kjeldsenii]
MSDDLPMLGWWAQLVRSSAFDDRLVRDVAMKKWGTDLVGSVNYDIEWLDTPLPSYIMISGTTEDTPPDFDEMANQMQPVMNDGEYFVFMYMMNHVLSNKGVQCIVITSHAVVKVSGAFMIEKAVDMALDTTR